MLERVTVKVDGEDVELWNVSTQGMDTYGIPKLDGNFPNCEGTFHNILKVDGVRADDGNTYWREAFEVEKAVKFVDVPMSMIAKIVMQQAYTKAEKWQDEEYADIVSINTATRKDGAGAKPPTSYWAIAVKTLRVSTRKGLKARGLDKDAIAVILAKITQQAVEVKYVDGDATVVKVVDAAKVQFDAMGGAEDIEW